MIDEIGFVLGWEVAVASSPGAETRAVIRKPEKSRNSLVGEGPQLEPE